LLLDRSGLLLLLNRLRLLLLFLNGFLHLLLLHGLIRLLHLHDSGTVACAHGSALTTASRLLDNGASRLEHGNVLTLLSGLNHLRASVGQALEVRPDAREALGEEQLKNNVTD
jgi:hypothetical protein